MVQDGNRHSSIEDFGPVRQRHDVRCLRLQAQLQRSYSDQLDAKVAPNRLVACALARRGELTVATTQVRDEGVCW
jgi:hypothetical protein